MPCSRAQAKKERLDVRKSIGWRDQYSIPNAVERRHRYVESLGLSSAFTPQAIVDGRRSFVGSDKRRILDALADQIDESVPVSMEVSDGVLTVEVPERPSHKTYQVFVAAYLPQASTPVGRGENSGRTLQEFNIVRQFRSIGSWSGHAAEFRASVESFPAECDPSPRSLAARRKRSYSRKRHDRIALTLASPITCKDFAHAATR